MRNQESGKRGLGVLDTTSTTIEDSKLVPSLDDAANVVTASFHVNLQLLGFPVLCEQRQGRARNLTVPRDFHPYSTKSKECTKGG